MSDDDPVIDPIAATVANAGDAAPVAAAPTLTDAASERSPTPGAETLVGQSLAHFRIDELLGKGGMGEVYLATDMALDRKVAIKVLSRDIAADERLRRRFFREARSQARIHHANVCHIYYIGEAGERLFFAMEYVEGESLQERIDRDGAVDAGVAVEICRLAALGLREANQHGFTHRDVKPSNLMVDKDNNVKVVDFGLVKEASGDPDQPGAAATTIDGTSIVGTPRYMAPEQARGEAVDFRADIYSLGATLHHLVAGEPPFAGPTPLAVLSQHLSDPRPHLHERKWKRRGPAPIDVLCDRMMAKDPAERFRNYDDVIATMENNSPARTRPAGFWVRIFALALDFIVVALLSWPIVFLGDEFENAIFAATAVVYSIFCHGRWGRTLGKFALEVEVVVVDQRGPPSYAAAALRFLAQWGIVYLFAGIATLGAALGYESVEQTATIIMVTTLLIVYPLEGILSSWAVPNNRTWWDRAARTQVRYRRLES